MRFEWDPEEARRNRAKHGVSFEEAATAFASDLEDLEARYSNLSCDLDRANYAASVDTSKPARRGQVKTGQVGRQDW